MIWLSERISPFSIPITMPQGYDADADVASLSKASTVSPPAYSSRSPSTKAPSGVGPMGDDTDHYRIQAWFSDPRSP